MNKFNNLAWIAISLAGAYSFSVAARIVNVGEKVNAVWILVAAICIYSLSYRFYSAFIGAKILALDDANATPAVLFNDGHDYDPTNRWVLFGHHFAAIAGAGPLIGPVLAAQFGYLPGMLWILIGSVLAGAVHDFIILVFSIRRNGKSLAEIAKDEIGTVTGLCAMLATFFIMIIVLAGLGMVVVKSLAESAWGTFTIGATIPIALLMGFYLRIFRPGKVSEVSVIGVVLLLLAVIFGKSVQDSPAVAQYFLFSEKSLIIVLMIYGFAASILPVWMLLAPRDYLSTYMKIGTIMLLTVGVFCLAPDIVFPTVSQFAAGGGLVIPGPLFPYLFITIACGAISGGHALFATGTTSKMLSKETDARMIGFGAMITEGFISLMALIAATSLVPGDYFFINSALSEPELVKLGFAPEKIHFFEQAIGVKLAGRTGGAVTLAVGMSNILTALPGMKAFIAYWYNFALMFEALFILTTIDAGTRVTRFLVQEFLGIFYKPFARYNWFPGMLFSSALVVLLWGYLIWTGNIATLWPLLGISNQLLSVLALTIMTSVLIKMKKFRYLWVTVIPMAMMAAVTLTTSWLQVNYFRSQLLKPDLAPMARFTFNLDIVLVLFMAGLTIVIMTDNVVKWPRFAREPYSEPRSSREGGKSEEPDPTDHHALAE